MPKLQPVLAVTLAALALTGCDLDDSQAPAPAESLVPLPSQQPAPPIPASDAAAANRAPAAARPSPTVDSCGAGKLGAHLDQLPTTGVMDDVRKAIGHERIRVIKPGDAVTMDMRPDRLNVELGEDGRIKLFRCG